MVRKYDNDLNVFGNYIALKHLNYRITANSKTDLVIFLLAIV